jgi:hypothetical protein
MKTAIVVKNRREAAAIRTALDDPQTRAFVLTMGTLLQLPSEQARRRVLTFVADMLNEDALLVGTATGGEHQ